MLNPTAPSLLTDANGRPYFLWDVDMSLDAFRAALASDERATRAYWTGKLMRQAKPDDVLTFVSLTQIGALWPEIQPYLGQTRPFWSWLLQKWGVVDG